MKMCIDKKNVKCLISKTDLYMNEFLGWMYWLLYEL